MAGKRDDNRVRALSGDLCLGNAGRVDAAADDLNGLVQVVGVDRDLGIGINLSLEDEGSAAREVESEPGRPFGLVRQNAKRQDRVQDDDDDAKPDEGALCTLDDSRHSAFLYDPRAHQGPDDSRRYAMTKATTLRGTA